MEGGKDWKCCGDTQDAEVTGPHSVTTRFQVIFRSKERMPWRLGTLERGSDLLAGASALALRDCVASIWEGSFFLNTCMWSSFPKTGGTAWYE